MVDGYLDLVRIMQVTTCIGLASYRLAQACILVTGLPGGSFTYKVMPIRLPGLLHKLLENFRAYVDR